MRRSLDPGFRLIAFFELVKGTLVAMPLPTLSGIRALSSSSVARPAAAYMEPLSTSPRRVLS